MPQRWLYLVRHGHYENNNGGSDGGPLTELGRKQARYAAGYLANVPVSAVYTSTMPRAWETAQIIGERLRIATVQPDDLLREIVPTIPPRLKAHIEALNDTHGGLSPAEVEDLRARADLAFAMHFQPPLTMKDEHEVIVCHGNLLRYFVAMVLDVAPDTWSHMMMYHCGITTVTINRRSRMDLIAHNETGFMPFQYRTEQ